MQRHSAQGIGRTTPNLKAAYARWQAGQGAVRRGDWLAALKDFEAAHSRVPLDTVYALNLARAQRELFRFDESIMTLRKISAREPNNLLVKTMLAECLAQQGDPAAAAECLIAHLDESRPDLSYLEGLCISLYESGRHQECLDYCLKALSLRIDHAQSHYLMGVCFNELGAKNEAIECMRTALALGYENGTGTLHSSLAMIESELCRWSESSEDMAALDVYLRGLPAETSAWISVFALATLSDDPWVIKRGAQACSKFAARHARARRPVEPLKPADGRIRVGFVSSDFHQHATTLLMAELIELMDHGRFEVFLYSHGHDDGSVMRERVKAAADHFVEVRGQGEIQVVERICKDGIDVLIDLKGHTSGNRLGLFAWRPAPVQVTWLGFPATTGADYIDYFIGDAHVSPLESADDFTEKLALMPACYQANDRKRPLPAPDERSRHGLSENALVLCGFNQPFKISREVFDCWCGLLQQREDAVLWLLAWNDSIESILKREAAHRGIDPRRLVFAPRVDFADHISRFALADVYLDAWPCNGHTTVSDALWASVPVVTYKGRTFASRVAASLLHNVGLPDAVCDSLQTYEARVLALCADVSERKAIREHLVKVRDTAPLFDSAAYARDFGHLLERMVARHRDGLAPDHLV
jgi:predicted O-linked N-acetylglucosamine transferase (SPINDLY family)